uniref:Uncharacterized protein n=1 Tax=Haptolina brevifila TaxID=156173 RepID=A0A7S2J6U3_9EUKA
MSPSVIDHVVESLDVLPTLLTLWGASIDGLSLDGHSLWPVLAGRAHARPRRRYARSELHLPCGLGCAMLNSPYDGKPPGFTRTPTVGPVVQLLLRTASWTYTATFLGQLPRPVRLIDEALFDAVGDPSQVRNLAYAAASAPVRWKMLDAMMREWGVVLSGPVNSSRWERAEWLRRRTSYRPNWWK